ncbi:MAG TPA: hypothetical protein VGA70_07495 [Longimicrobiales bacterium]|jgi:hypothetical protein
MMIERPRSVRGIWLPLTVAILVAQAGCQEEVPTGLDGDLIPVAPKTTEVVLGWDEFASSIEVLGGFGAPVDLPASVVARDYRGVLESRTLVHWATYPRSASVRDSLGTTRVDSMFTFVGGRVVVHVDTLASVALGPMEFKAYSVDTDWDPVSVTWTHAVDTANHREAWPEAGAGPGTEVAAGTWVPADGDSLIIVVDSAAVARWGDTTRAVRSMRLDLDTPGGRLSLTRVNLRLDARPSIHQDTIITLSSAGLGRTFVYDPFPEPPPDGIRIGGVPAWRSIIGWDMPTVLNGPPAFCERMGCPFDLDPARVSSATLVLHSAASEPAFQPSDTVRLDLRAVLSPERLPKSPLGATFTGGLGRAVAPEAFGDAPGQVIAISVTTFVRNILGGPMDGLEPPNVLALLSVFEPLSLSFASFVGPGGALEPSLHLILTTADTVEIR